MAWWRDRGDWGYYRKSKPKKATGGIKSQSKRGQFGESWWAKRWIEVLNGFNLGARLARGRSYARSGQVLSIAVEPGQVRAKVQGSRPQPYNVMIETKTLSPAECKALGASLAKQAIFAAKLLAGEMPREIETVFRDAGLSLFPSAYKDLETDCSCPDWSNPCKHIAAVYYLLGEEFDRDPFLIFTLRGLDREALVALLPDVATAPAGQDLAPAAPPEPLPTSAETFWNGRSLGDDFLGVVEVPTASAAIPRRLGGFPFWRGERPFPDAIEPIYSAASPIGLELVLGRREPEGKS